MKQSERMSHLAAKKRVGRTMENFYSTEGMTLDKAKELLFTIEDDLILLLPAYQERDDDYRLGNDSYGYYQEFCHGGCGTEHSELCTPHDLQQDDEKGILTNLSYVSDRWGGAFRISWMLGVINRNYR